MNKKYQIFYETIRNVIQESGLDIGVVYFIMKNIFCDIENSYYVQLNRELSEEKISEDKNEDKSKEKDG